MSTDPRTDETELAAHFAFGANWRRFLSLVDEARIEDAERSLRSFLQLGEEETPLAGKRFLDAGCGSGLFSLAAVRLGAEVVSFDLDPASTACAFELKRRFAHDCDRWTITEGSALDHAFLESLGHFAIVYSWGVLHHTGAMWSAIDAVCRRTNADGQFFLAIYNDQHELSEIWRGIKKGYVSLPHWLQTPYVIIVGAGYYGARVAMAVARKFGKLLLGRPSPSHSHSEASVAAPNDQSNNAKKHYGDRGMSRWYDLVDWVGGYPFEVATSDALVEFLTARGFQLEKLRTVGGKLGCNELVFRRTNDSDAG